jgi:pimeloyl-ACP methyl ester carboxylesterase
MRTPTAIILVVLCGSLLGASAAVIPARGAPQVAAAGDPSGTFATMPGRRLWYVDTGGTGYRVVAYDRVGWGRSELDDGAAPGTAADDLQALIGLLRIERFHLVGTAAGGFVAFDYALSFPERLRSLTVANSIGGVQDEAYLALGRRLRPAPQFDALPVEVRELGPSYRAADAAGTARWVELSRRSRLARALPSPQTFRNRITFARLDTIRVPALLISGGADLYSPPPMMRLYGDHLRGAETLVVPDAGHSVFWENAELFNRSLLAFLARY